MFPIASLVPIATLVRSALFTALTAHTKPPFPYANLRGCLFFSPPEAVQRVQGAHLAGMCANEAGGHTDTFHGGGVRQVLNGH